LLSGCVAAAPTFRADPSSVSVNDNLDIILSPLKSPNGSWITGFQLQIVNNTLEDIELNWNRTLYLDNGQSRGGFIFEGLVWAERNNPKAPDMIFTGQVFKKEIYPNIRVDVVDLGSKKRWYNKHMSAGRHGASLSLWVDGQEVRREVSIDIVES